METNNITYRLINQYLEGKLDEKSMHELEKQALEDPFLADALEGYAYSEKYAGPQLSILQRQLEERIAEQHEKKNLFYFTWQRISVAATACILFTAASMLFWMKGNRSNDSQLGSEKKVDIHLTHPDSLDRKKTPVTAITPAGESVISDPLMEIDIASASPKVEQASPLGYFSERKVQGGKLSASKYNQVIPASQGDEMNPAAAMTSLTSFQDTAKMLSGRVVSKSGEPLPDVSVKVQGENKGTITDGDGRFVLPDSVSKMLYFAYLGYKSKIVRAEAGKPVLVTLEEDRTPLDEVVIAGNGPKKQDLPTAVPAEGWKKYNRYLERKIKVRSAVPGEVVVFFLVGADGTLSNFVIEKGLNDLADKEAIRLIKEGPEWKSSGPTEARVTVKFK